MDKKEFFADVNDFYNSWEDFIWIIKKYKTRHNETYNKDLYVGLKVLELLMWYGISIEKIPDIKLSDVSYKGIKGCNITFDEKTLDLFVRYKKMTSLSVSRGIDEKPADYDLKQDTFFRTISRKSNDTVTSVTISRFMSKLMKVEEEDKEFQKLFLPNYIYRNGSLCYAYDRLNGKNPKIEIVCRLASEFGVEFKKESSDKTYFKKFKKYYVYRQKWEEEHKEQNQAGQSEQSEQIEDIKSTLSETTRATAEDVKQLVDNIVNNPISSDQLEEPKTEQENTIDICLDILNGLRTSISLINNQIDTLESVLKTIK